MSRAYWADGGLLDLAPWMARDHVDPGQFLAPTNAYTSSGGKRWSLPDARRRLRPLLRPLEVRGRRHHGATPNGRRADRVREAPDGAQPGWLVAGRRLLPAPRLLRELRGELRAHVRGQLDRRRPVARPWGRSPAGRRCCAGRRSSSTGTDTTISSGSRPRSGWSSRPTTPSTPGELAMMIDGPWRVAMLASGAPNVDYGTAPVPVDGEQPELYGSGYVNGSIIGIPVDADHKAESWKLVKYLATDVGGADEALERPAQRAIDRGVPRVARADAERAFRGLPRHRGEPAQQHHAEHGPRDAVPDGLCDVPGRVAIGRSIRPAGRPAGRGSPDRRAAGAGYGRQTTTDRGVAAATVTAVDRLVGSVARSGRSGRSEPDELGHVGPRRAMVGHDLDELRARDHHVPIGGEQCPHALEEAGRAHPDAQPLEELG